MCALHVANKIYKKFKFKHQRAEVRNDFNVLRRVIAREEFELGLAQFMMKHERAREPLHSFEAGVQNLDQVASLSIWARARFPLDAIESIANQGLIVSCVNNPAETTNHSLKKRLRRNPKKRFEDQLKVLICPVIVDLSATIEPSQLRV